MAYTGIDKEIYDSGTHFRPLQEYTQQQWTPPAIMGQNTNAGITNTQAAGSYMGYPSYEAWLLAQGGGGGGGNDPVDNINRGGINQNLGPTNITDYESEAYGVGPTWAGSWARAKDAYSKLPTPGNLIMKGIRKWKENRDTKRAEEQRIKEIEVSQRSQDNAIAAGGGQPQSGITAGTTAAQAAGMGGGSRQATSAGSTNSGRTDGGWGWAQGGRIGLRPGGIVDAGKQYYGKEDWEIQQINKYGVSYPEFLQNQYGKGLHEMDIGEIATAVKAWDSWRSSQAQGGLIGYFDGGIARLL
jgi:hypothetical protein